MTGMAFRLLGRLSVREYAAIVAGFTFVVLEALLHILVALLPTPVIRWFYNRSRVLFNSLSPQRPRPRSGEVCTAQRILRARDFVDLCAVFG
ncbi:hypothetical protein C0992_003146, partial [Termitomyces sp. T32_za158]